MRFPEPFAWKVQGMCDRLLEDKEEALVDALQDAENGKGLAEVAKAMCGTRGLAVCKDRKGKWFGRRSPFALGPAYMAKSHDEL